MLTDTQIALVQKSFAVIAPMPMMRRCSSINGCSRLTRA
jgi:hypothetical protein